MKRHKTQNHSMHHHGHPHHPPHHALKAPVPATATAPMAAQQNVSALSEAEINAVGNAYEKIATETLAEQPELRQLMEHNGLPTRDIPHAFSESIKAGLRETPADVVREASADAALHGRTLSHEQQKAAIKFHELENRLVIGEAGKVDPAVRKIVDEKFTPHTYMPRRSSFTP